MSFYILATQKPLENNRSERQLCFLASLSFVTIIFQSVVSLLSKGPSPAPFPGFANGY